MIQILFAFLAGILTIAAPCILPMLPIILGASVGQTGKKRPLFIVLGFIISFAAASLVLSLIVTHLGLSQNTIRYAAIYLLLVFAFFMIWPTPFELLTVKLSGAINKANQMGNSQSGNTGGFFLGLVLGIVWTPCAGPVLGTILTLIATQGTTAKAFILVIAYALGAGIPMMIIAYGSQWITTKVRSIAQYSRQIQQVFGVLILLLAVAMYFQIDTRIENSLTAFFPQSTLEAKLVGENPQAGSGPNGKNTDQTTNTMDTVQLQNYGQAPNFTGIYHWLNLPAGQDSLNISDLKGKVVLVDFWTYSCINCLRTLPYVTKWYDEYKNDGLVVIGVHTPEFAFEKVTSNVQNAINQNGIHYPVAQDNDYGTWNAYNNEYWPAEYLINKDGEIVHEHFGEGEYDVTENAIRELLGLNATTTQTSTLGNIESPEMYFEPDRLQYLTPDQQPSTNPTNYSLPATVALNNFALGGQWQFDTDHAQTISAGATIRLHFSSGKLYMVAAAADPAKPITLKITVDGVAQPDVTVTMSQLYTLFSSNNYAEHTVDITISDPGFEAYTFTFG
jgi:cytochrome c biogenesis protein CcdA/thiol-disulfide isomerase/thioredoxin